MLEAKNHGYDLDEGLLVKYQGQFYYGKDGMHILAILGSKSDLFNKTNSTLFKSKILLTILYPILKFIRRCLLMILGVKKIKPNNNDPILKAIFGDLCSNMPSVLKNRYSNRQYSNDTLVFEGNMNIKFSKFMKILKPMIVINTCGPFQNANYLVVNCCIKQGVHYIDIADGRDFVSKISELDGLAKQTNSILISGTSTVPCLSSAVLEEYKDEFSQIDSLIYGIIPGQKTSRGLATVRSILDYLGKPLKSFTSNNKIYYGWQDIYKQKYRVLGKRWMANCDIADLDIFPKQYNIRSIQFSAGMENSFLHLSIWILGWLKRFGLPIKLENHANFLLRLSNLFNIFSTADGGIHMIIKGKNKSNKMHERKWFIIAKNGSGPYIPSVASVY